MKAQPLRRSYASGAVWALLYDYVMRKLWAIPSRRQMGHSDDDSAAAVRNLFRHLRMQWSSG